MKVITKGTIIVHIEYSLECISLGIFEWDYEGVKERHLIGLKYNIKEGDKLGYTVDST